jgi:tetratricopeptide (TPR) repeat protein
MVGMGSVRRMVLWVFLVAALLGTLAGVLVVVGLARWGAAGWYYHQDANYRLRCAQRLLHSGDIDHARDVRLVLEADGAKDQAAMLRGEELFLQAQPYAQADRLDVAAPLLQAAIDEFIKIRDKGELSTESAVITGKCHLFMKQLHKAERVFLFVLSQHPDIVDVQRGLASIYFDQGAMARAIFHLEKWAELDPHDGRPYRLAAFIYKEQESYEDAIKNYGEALRRDLPLGVPNQKPERIRKELVECLVKRTEFKRALELIDEFSPLPEDASALEVLRAECLLGLGQLPEARTVLENALELYQDNNRLYRLRAKVHTDAGEYTQALTCLERALFIDRQDIESHYQLLLTLRQLGRQADADKEQRVFDGIKMDNADRQRLEHEALDRPWDGSLRLRLAELWQKAGRSDLAQMCREAAAQCPPAPMAAGNRQNKHDQ